MATPQILTFPSTLAPTIPTFVANGSKIEVPDLQVVFWGPYWPGSGQRTVDDLMQAVSSMVTGPYLEGMRQYGYTGPVNVRQPIINTGNPNISLTAPGLNVNQVPSMLQAVFNLVDNLRQNNSMGDVTSNHDLVVLVFLDPSIPFPQVFGPTGVSQSTVYGEHAEYQATRFLAPAIRFAYGWICTQPANGLSAFDQATWTFSHELVEAISNPFPNSGWVQTVPPSPSGAGEIGDICNNVACVVDSIVVQPYWGVQQSNCILPTEARHLSLDQTLTKHEAHDSATQWATVDMGPLCGKGSFDYVERTWDNTVAVTAVHPGYGTPVFSWSINGTALPQGSSTFVVPATWVLPTMTVNFGIVNDHLQQQIEKLPLAASGHQMVAEPFTPLAHASFPAAPAPFLTPIHPGEDPLHRNIATLRIAIFGPVLTAECGPGEGNCSFTIDCQAVENWDSNAGTTATTQLSTNAFVQMTNEELIWGSAYKQAANDCYAKTHKAEQPSNPVQPRNPGDPGPEGEVRKVEGVEHAQQIVEGSASNRVR